MAEAAPNGRYELIPDAGHAPQLQHPGAVARALEKLLARTAAG
jgi:pimeloyl-ACP methyl ester carboxylesterase